MQCGMCKMWLHKDYTCLKPTSNKNSRSLNLNSFVCFTVQVRHSKKYLSIFTSTASEQYRFNRNTCGASISKPRLSHEKQLVKDCESSPKKPSSYIKWRTQKANGILPLLVQENPSIL